MWPRCNSVSPSVACLVWSLLGLGLLSSGCAPRVIVRANPTAADRGIRYYRPKPYLKVEPAEVAIEKNQTTIVPGLVRISLVYLPDFSEEYAIDVRSGLGIANVGIKLEDGWNLTEISQELDSQTDENVRAMANLLTAVGDIVPTASGTSKSTDVSFTVPARNVPIGFYESIIGRDQRGCKRLYGFRYVGFVPFASCPLDMGGQQAACCNSPETGLYGLTFVSGQMVFLPLDEMAHAPARDARQSTAEEKVEKAKSGRTSAELGSAEPLDLPLVEPRLPEMETALRAHLIGMFDGIGEVRGKRQAGLTTVVVQVPPGSATEPIRNAAEDWLRSLYGIGSPLDVEITTAATR
jgi:hypothetical protein